MGSSWPGLWSPDSVLRYPVLRSTDSGFRVPDTGPVTELSHMQAHGTERMSGIPASFPYATTSPDSRVACNLRVILENSGGGG